MKALLLAGGEGKRLRPLTNKLPKCMMPIQGRPLLDIWLKELKNTGVISKVLINVFYKKNIVIDYLLNSSWRNFIEIADEEELLGTAGTIFKNYAFFENENFFVAHADNLCITNLKSFLKSHDKRPCEANLTMMLFKTNTPETCGIVKLNNKNLVEEFFEKQKENNGNLANGAVFIFNKNIKEITSRYIDIQKVPLDISQNVIPIFLGKINTFVNKSVHIDIGNVSSWKAANSVKVDTNFNENDADLWNDILQKVQWTY